MIKFLAEWFYYSHKLIEFISVSMFGAVNSFGKRKYEANYGTRLYLCISFIEEEYFHSQIAKL